MILPDAVEPTIGSVSRAARWPGPQRRVRNEDADESFAQPLYSRRSRVRSAEGVPLETTRWPLERPSDRAG